MTEMTPSAPRHRADARTGGMPPLAALLLALGGLAVVVVVVLRLV